MREIVQHSGFDKAAHSHGFTVRFRDVKGP